MMGMPITVEIADPGAGERDLDVVFAYFGAIDERFSLYKPTSEITALNQRRVEIAQASSQLRDVLELAAKTKLETGGYFDIQRPDGTLDPSGIVKGWAIHLAAGLVRTAGWSNFYIDAGGDVQSQGRNGTGEPWRIGICNPFNEGEIVKVVSPRGHGVATSGSYARGAHIYDPHQPETPLTDIVSLTVIGQTVLEADRFATAAFAMGRAGIHFIERRPQLEAYAIDSSGVATFTSGFGSYVVS